MAEKEIKTKSISWTTYILPLATILLLFMIASYFIINSINAYFINHTIEDANRHAETHTSRLSNSIYANKIINELLGDRLVGVGNRVIRRYKTSGLNNEILREMSEDLKVDKIYWYDSTGKVIYTASDYLGWQAKEGDPIYNFMKSDKDILVEAIRPDTDSGKLVKYAQIKTNNGEFVQVGILAENIRELTGKFCPQGFIDLLVKQDNIVHGYYLNNENELVFCDDQAHGKRYKLDDNQKRAIERNEAYYSKKNHAGKEVYETLLPINIDDTRMGTLIILYSLEHTKVLINKVSTIALSLLILIFMVYELMILKIVRKNREIEKLAYYDSVTGLLNKNYFLKLLKDDLESRSTRKKALLIINFGNLNLIKLIFGQELLDDLLIKKANKLRELNISEDTIFRYSEDSFCVYIVDYRYRDYLTKKSKFILNNFDKTKKTIENSEFITTKIGIIEISKAHNQIDDLIKHMEISINGMDEIEDKSYAFFDETIQRELMLNEMMEKELRRAIHDGYNEFYLEYQPQIDLKTNKLIGLEALARWNNKEFGMVSPTKFIDIAERFQLITSLGNWIMETACKFIKTLENHNIRGIKVAVNISVIQLLQENFVEDLMELIDKIKINPNSLELEITESNFMKNYEIANQRLRLLREKGISIALDDFGTGYASLERLNNLNIDVLKIDKSFIDNIVKDNQDDIFVKNIILLANELNLKTVAEGVETEEQKEYLKIKDCDIMQGYLFSKPVSSNEAIELIKKTNEG